MRFLLHLASPTGVLDASHRPSSVSSPLPSLFAGLGSVVPAMSFSTHTSARVAPASTSLMLVTEDGVVLYGASRRIHSDTIRIWTSTMGFIATAL